MLLFSGLSGARGDFIVGTVILGTMLILKLKFRSICLLACIFVVLGIGMLDRFGLVIEELIIFRRMAAVVMGETFGGRDILFSQALDLVSSQSICMILGCGFNFFQVYYGYSFGMYPHNTFLEILITFGLILGLPIIIFTIWGVGYGLFTYYRDKFLFWLFLYFLGVSLKSGSLVGMTGIPVIIFFAYLGICASKAAHTKLFSLTGRRISPN
jgi:hypothetical protein